MAVSFLANYEVSDLCIGKPALKPLLVSASVSDALLALRRCSDSYLTVWLSATTVGSEKSDSGSGCACVGKVCAVDIICFLCSDANICNPISALKSPISGLLSPSAGATASYSLVRSVDPRSSVSEALDLILEGGAQNLVIPIRSSPRRKKSLQSGDVDFCCLTQEDFVRFFLNSIGLFSPVPALSIESLGIIETEILTVRYHDPAISAVHLLKQASLSQSAVAVVTDDGKLAGEISPSTLAFFFAGGEDSDTISLPAAVATLSAGELMAYLDCGGGGTAISTIKERLKEKNLKGMLELIEEDYDEITGSSSSSVTSSSSSSSSDDESPPTTKRSNPRKYNRSGSYSARMGRRSEEAIVCHPHSSLVAVMIQALAHRVSYVWVVEEDYGVVGVVGFPDIVKVFRDHMV